jgi:hypothetical protein
VGANFHANGGSVLVDLDLPDFREYAIDVSRPAAEHHESTRQLGKMIRDIFIRNADQANFRLVCPDELNSNRLGAVFEVENRCTVGPVIDIDEDLAPDGRVMEVLSEHSCEGWLGRLSTDRAPWVVRELRGIRNDLGVDDRSALQVARGRGRSAMARVDRLARYPALLHLLAERPQWVQPPGARV